MFTVYCHTNTKNGMPYIGITNQDPERRWLNGEGYSKNKKFYKDIKKYGWNKFSHEILADNLSKEQAVKLEQELIEKYDSVRNGYNNSYGGKYAEKNCLCHYANEVKNGIKRNSASDLKCCQNILDIFDNCDAEGEESSFTEQINAVVEAIIDKFKQDGRKLNFQGIDFIADFCWEWNRFWKIHEYICENDINPGDDINIDEMFPPYTRREIAFWEEIEKPLPDVQDPKSGKK